MGSSAASEWLERGAAAAAARRWSEAARAYHEALALAPDDPSALEGLGLAALHAGDPRGALEWLERAERAAPDNARVLSHLGIAQRRNGQLSRALETLRRAVALAPEPSIWLNLGRAEREAGQLERAIQCFEQALALREAAPEAWSMLSNALREAGRIEPALAAAERALALEPRLGEAHLNAGAALHRLGRLPEALASYWAARTQPSSRAPALANIRVALAEPMLAAAPRTRAAQLVSRLLATPNDAECAIELARAERESNRLAVALVALEHALGLAPRAAVHHELGTLCWELGRVAEAQAHLARAFEASDAGLETYRRLAAFAAAHPKLSLAGPRWAAVLERCPSDVFSLVNLGVALQRQGLPSMAVELAQRALARAPRSLEAQVNLGSALSDQGRFAEAFTAYRRALELAPEHAAIASNMLFSMHFEPSATPEQIRAAHVEFGRRFGAPLAPGRASHTQRREPERRLRVAYVSPDLRWHPVAYFLEPVLRAHDAERFEVHCYSDVERPDEVTERLARLVPSFVSCRGWSDAALAEHVRGAQIDILVDLAGHTGHNRLLTFARKPSPVQVSWLGYFDTTGLDAIDYRIADAASVPDGAERLFVERVLRLPRSANCFLHPPAPEPAGPPCRARGHVTFGYLNNPAKLTRDAAAAFARILSAVPGSRLLLKYGAFEDPALRTRTLDWLSRNGVAPERVTIAGHSSLPRFLASFAEVDVALDPFPYSGETTALHTLWMGVPLVALEGQTVVQRLASRVLRVAGLDAWVASTPDEYVHIAVALARDEAALARWRTTLRDQLRASPLLDHTGFTRELEAAYRAMWREYCSLSNPAP